MIIRQLVLLGAILTLFPLFGCNNSQTTTEDPKPKTSSSKASPSPHPWQKLERRHTLKMPNPVRLVAVSPDAQIVAGSTLNGDVQLWNLQTGKPYRTLPKELAGKSISFSPNSHPVHRRETAVPAGDPNSTGQFFATGDLNGKVRLWQLSTGKVLRTFSGHTSEIRSIAFSPDGKTLATGSADRTVKLWNVQTGKLLHTLSSHPDRIMSIAFSPDGQTFASSSYDGTINLWQPTTGKLIRILAKQRSPIYTVLISPDNQYLLSGNADGEITLWDLKSRTIIYTLKAHEDVITDMDLSADGQILASTSRDEAVKLWDTKRGKLLHTLKGDFVTTVAFSPKDAILVTGDQDGNVGIWQVPK